MITAVSGANGKFELTCPMYLNGLGTAVPEKRYSQRECWDAVCDSGLCERLQNRSRAILKKVLTGNNGIATRHLALDDLKDAFEIRADVLQARFAKHAPALATAAAQRALADASLEPKQIDALLISTCTGYLCPGLTSYVSQSLDLRSDALLLDLVGQGCGAALPNMRTAEALLASQGYRNVLSVCVEVCSAALYFDDDPGVLISACLFGDGAGAAVLSASAGTKYRIQWRGGGTLLNANNRDLLRFEHRDGMLRNILRPEVPELAGQHAAKVFEQVAANGGVARENVRGWVLHPGGRDVLNALSQSLRLAEHDSRWSESVLRNYGNLSSPSVYFVLDAALHDSAESGTWWMSSFGAGFSCHGALLNVEL